MAIEILLTIPDEFDTEFIKNHFSASLLRLAADANTLAGEYEKETAAMLIEAFQNSKWARVMPNGLKEQWVENPWISVKDKLPPVHFNVLIDCGDNDYHIARMDKYFCWYVEDGDYILEDDCEPIAWMPIPKKE